MTGDLMLLFGLLAAIALGDCAAVLLVRADERQFERNAEAEQAAAPAERRLHRPPASVGANSPTQANHCRPAFAGSFPAHQPTHQHDDVSPLLVAVQSSDRWVP